MTWADTREPWVDIRGSYFGDEVGWVESRGPAFIEARCQRSPMIVSAYVYIYLLIGAGQSDKKDHIGTKMPCSVRVHFFQTDELLNYSQSHLGWHLLSHCFLAKLYHSRSGEVALHVIGPFWNIPLWRIHRYFLQITIAERVIQIWG